MATAREFHDVQLQVSLPTLLDYSYSEIESQDLEEALSNQPESVFESVQTILSNNNALVQFPEMIFQYVNLKNLDISFNGITNLSDSLMQCVNLTSLVARNNLLDELSFPKSMKNLVNLKELNLSGNNIQIMPHEVLEVTSLVTLHMGANKLSSLCSHIKNLRKLEVLYLGGNELAEIPDAIGELTQMKVLVLCENKLERLPSTLSNLKSLKSLLLHRNRITALPIELVKLRNLMELSLRDNPLVFRFVREMVYNPPSLMELAGRTIKIQKIKYASDDLPQPLVEWLTTGHRCLNPRCKGVYFDQGIEHIKFLDFCGKYRIPLLQYLCSEKCSDQQSPAFEGSDSDSDEDLMRKVLLGNNP